MWRRAKRSGPASKASLTSAAEAEFAQGLELAAGGRQLERPIEPDGCRDGIGDKAVQIGVTERVEHLALLVGAGADMAVGKTVRVGK